MIPRVCLQFVLVVFPDHTHLLFFESSLEVVLHSLGDSIYFFVFSGSGGSDSSYK